MIKSLFKLGVTGGIGSGKTSVCRVFDTLGIPVFSADQAAKEVMDNDERIMDGLNSVTGRELYPDGSLDRGLLAKLIFHDSELLGKVNAIVHPVVFERFNDWLSHQDASYAIMEAAILFESGASKMVDKVVTIIAPEEERIKRVMHRNNLSREQVMDRIRNQMSDKERKERSDYLIYNSEKDMIIPAVIEIHNSILSYINSTRT